MGINKVNDGLIVHQEQLRAQSVEQVKWAVQYIKDLEGSHYHLSACKVSKITGLSRAVLYKSHLRGLWDVDWDGEKSKEALVRQKECIERTKLLQSIVELETQIKKMENHINKLTNDLSVEKARSSVYKNDYNELKERHQVLLHHNLRILRKLHIHGIDTSEFEDQETEY